MHPYFSHPGPHVLAHQGLAIDCKPNSLAAFAAALEAGADFIETDAHGTRDGVAVLFHDEELNGVKISSLLKTQLPEYIPTLSSALTTFPAAKFNIDIKNFEACEPVAAEINSLSAQDRVLLTSFSSFRRKKTMQLAPGTASSPGVGEFGPALIAALCGQQRLVTRYLSRFDAVQIPSSVLGVNIVSKRLVKMYHAAGVKVHVWTINDPEHMRTLMKTGVDGIVTDSTDLAVIALKN